MDSDPGEQAEELVSDVMEEGGGAAVIGIDTLEFDDMVRDMEVSRSPTLGQLPGNRQQDVDDTAQDREASDSATLDQMPFNPQQFIDDVFNAANEIVENAFDIMEENSPKLLHLSNDSTLEALSKGFDAVFNTVQATLDKNLCRWEDYCLANCFAVPEQFPDCQKATPCGMVPEEYSGNAGFVAGLKEEELDTELEAVRSKLAVAGKFSAKMRRELRSLERRLSLKTMYKEALQDAVKELEDGDTQDVFEEVVRTGQTLKEKLNKLKGERVHSPRGIRFLKSDLLSELRSQDLADVVNSFAP